MRLVLLALLFVLILMVVAAYWVAPYIFPELPL